MFSTKHDQALLESVKKAMEVGDIARLVTEEFNKQIGIYSRNSLANELRPIYDRVLGDIIKEHVDSGKKNYDFNHNKSVENREYAMLTKGGADDDDDDDDKKKKKHVKEEDLGEGKSTNGKPITPVKGSWAATMPAQKKELNSLDNHKNGSTLIKKGWKPLVKEAIKKMCEDSVSVHESQLTPFQQAFADARAAAKAQHGNASIGSFKFKVNGVDKDFQTNIKGEKYLPQSRLKAVDTSKKTADSVPMPPANNPNKVTKDTMASPTTRGLGGEPSNAQTTVDSNVSGKPTPQGLSPTRSASWGPTGADKEKPTFRKKYEADKAGDSNPTIIKPDAPAAKFGSKGVGSDYAASGGIGVRSTFKPAEKPDSTILPPVEVNKPPMLPTRAGVKTGGIGADAVADRTEPFKPTPTNTDAKSDKLTPNSDDVGPSFNDRAPNPIKKDVVQEETIPKKKYQTLSSVIRETLNIQ